MLYIRIKSCNDFMARDLVPQKANSFTSRGQISTSF